MGKNVDATSSIEEIRNFLDKTKFKETKTLLNLLDSCHSVEGLKNIVNIAKSMRDDSIMPDLEFCGFELLIEKMISTGAFNAGNSLINEFKQRILSTTDIGKVMQFRNCITDMLMLDFLQLGEYIELNNEIDSYIQNTITKGGIK